MNKSSLILKYFQKKDQLTVANKDYQKTVSSLFKWLTENDRVNNDKTSKYFSNIPCTAKMIAKDKGILAGLEEIKYLLKTYTRLSFKTKLSDGQEFKEKETIAQISGKSYTILAYERTILNILQRMSGIATETNRMIKSLKTPQGWLVSKDSPGVEETEPIQRFPYLAATRKTPWMSLDKKAVAVGGGLTHRLNLSDGILIKDNHLTFLSIEKALESIISKGNTKAVKTPRGWPVSKDSPGVEVPGRLIEIEVTNEKQALVVIRTYQKLTTTNHQPPTTNHLAILLDNFSPSLAKTLLRDLNDLFDLSNIIFEASGGIDKSNIQEWAKTGVDILSLGALTHSVKATNLSLELL